MRSDEPPRPRRLLEDSPESGGYGPDDFEGHGAWPSDWRSGSHSAADDEQALRDLREGLVRSRVPGGARWEVPVRAALAAALLAFVIAVGAGFLLLRNRSAEVGESVPPAPSVSVSVAPMTDAAAHPDLSPSPAVVGTVGSVRVHVVGQVKKPGVVSLGTDARVQDAIEAAGGAGGRADLGRLNLARKVVDGERILVPKPVRSSPTKPPLPVPGPGPVPGPAERPAAVAPVVLPVRERRST